MKAKKVLAMLMASAMIMGTSVTAFAATPTANDSKDVYDSITGIEDGATITAYRIIEPKYTEDGFVGYKWADGVNGGGNIEVTDNKVTGLDDTLVTSIAKDSTLLASLEKESTTVAANAQFNLNAGTWLLIVNGAVDVYNPMIISVYYDTTGSGTDAGLTNGSVDADTKWNLYNTEAYAKSTEIKIDKEVEKVDEDAEVGSSVSFTIEGTIPAYSDQYTTVKYNLKDTFTNGLTMEAYTTTWNGTPINVEKQNDPVVYVGGKEESNKVAPTNYTYTLHSKVVDGEGKVTTLEYFEINFKDTYIKSLKNASEAERKVYVEYEATVTEAAITTPAVNDVVLDYTHKPGEDTDTDDTEKVYSVSLDNVMKKVQDDGETGLDGATFTLYRGYTDSNDNDKPEADELENPVGEYTTLKNDYDIEFKGLDADTIYYLTETAAPDGYTINDTVYKIEFRDLADDNGTVTYKVYINDVEKTTITYGSPATTPVENVVNTKLSSLPSTGGIGTTIFTIGGCAIMITAAGLYFATRKKVEK